MTTTRTDTLPHPDYGLADETRWTILRDAAETTVKAAAEAHGVHPSIIYIWRKRLGPRSEKQ